MTEYDEKLRTLQEQLARRRKIETMLNELNRQRFALEDEVSSLEETWRLEQADVDQLEGRSLTALFYTLTGQKAERLDKERAEACAAAAKYDAARAHLHAVEQDIDRLQTEQRELAALEKEMQMLQRQKQAFLKENDPIHGAEIIRLEEQLAALRSLEQEIKEGVWAGNDVLRQIGVIESKLSDAEGWGIWDLAGGGLISTMAKHSALSDAQGMIDELQILLGRFRTELADVQISADMKVQMDGFLHFADYFFDGLFADWAALDHIRGSQQQVSDTKAQVDRVMWQLDTMRGKTEAEIAQTEEKLRDLVINA